MLKKLLKNYPQVAALETKGFKSKSKIDDNIKYKLLKSWVKGGSRSVFCALNNITEKEYQIVTEDLIQEAKCTGDSVVISIKQSLSEGTLWLFGLISDRFNANAAIAMLGLSRSSKAKYVEEYEVVTGEKVEIRSRLKDRNYFTKISDEFIYHSPVTGREMNQLSGSTFYSEEITLLKMKSSKIEAVYYCKDSFSEYMLYKGDDRNPPGTYEFHFEYLTESENNEAVA